MSERKLDQWASYALKVKQDVGTAECYVIIRPAGSANAIDIQWQKTGLSNKDLALTITSNRNDIIITGNNNNLHVAHTGPLTYLMTLTFVDTGVTSTLSPQAQPPDVWPANSAMQKMGEFRASPFSIILIPSGPSSQYPPIALGDHGG